MNRLHTIRAVGLMASAALAYGQGTITVYSDGSVAVGTTRQLSAYVPLSPNTVVWSVNGVTGGDGTYGTVSPTGLYKAPATAPAMNVVEVRATSTAYPNNFGKVSIKVSQPTPWVWSAYPNPVPAGNATLSVNGASFLPTSVAYVNGQPFQTKYDSPTKVTATGVVTGSGKVPVVVTNPGNGAVTSQAFLITVSAPVPPPPPAISYVSPSSFQAGNFSLTLAGSGFVNGSQVNFGGAPITTVYVSPSQLTAAGSTQAAAGASIPVSVSNPAPNAAASNTINVTISATPAANMSLIKAGRFLEQAAYGPTTADINKVMQDGIDPWLDEQLAMAETPIPMTASVNEAKGQFLNRAAQAPDQLRQKMIYALSQIIVISANKNIYPDELVPYYQILSKHAFGNYKALLKEITLSPQMGKYLDMGNSVKPSATGGANENYPRELLQLFTIGLWQLNQDGSNKMDAQNKPISTYTQADVAQFALALTGWTFQPAAGTNLNYYNFTGPLAPRPQHHDTSAKTLLNGTVLPAGQTPQQDLDGVIDNVFGHPNVAPFISTRLIRALVTSNPSGPYIQRIAKVFTDTGGDLKAVVKAIITDTEARQDTATINQGRLKDSIYQTVALVRALNGNVAANNLSTYIFVTFGQNILAPNSVFGFYSPMFRVPKSPLFGPEFQIYSASEATLRGNLMASILSGSGADFTVNLGPFNSAAANAQQLVDVVDQTLLYGRMPASMRNSLVTAVNAQYDNAGRVFTALYLTALSGQYAIQY